MDVYCSDSKLFSDAVMCIEGGKGKGTNNTNATNFLIFLQIIIGWIPQYSDTIALIKKGLNPNLIPVKISYSIFSLQLFARKGTIN